MYLVEHTDVPHKVLRGKVVVVETPCAESGDVDPQGDRVCDDPDVPVAGPVLVVPHALDGQRDQDKGRVRVH